MCQNLNIWVMFWMNQVRNDAVCHRKVESGMNVAGTIRSLVNVKGLQFECARGLHKTLLVHVLMYGNETMI